MINFNKSERNNRKTDHKINISIDQNVDSETNKQNITRLGKIYAISKT